MWAGAFREIPLYLRTLANDVAPLFGRVPKGTADMELIVLDGERNILAGEARHFHHERHLLAFPVYGRSRLNSAICTIDLSCRRHFSLLPFRAVLLHVDRDLPWPQFLALRHHECEKPILEACRYLVRIGRCR